MESTEKFRKWKSTLDDSNVTIKQNKLSQEIKDKGH